MWQETLIIGLLSFAIGSICAYIGIDIAIMVVGMVVLYACGLIGKNFHIILKR